MNVYFVYNINNPESYELANYYKQIKNLSSDSLVGINCSEQEILNSYTDFYNQVESQIVSEIGLEYTNDVYIILGYRVPGGFRDSNDIISSTSRISRMSYSYVKKQNNPAYYPSENSIFNTSDFAQIFICSRIDAPTLIQAKNIIDKANNVSNFGFATGKFYFDKISRLNYDYSSWQELISWDMSVDDVELLEAIPASERLYYYNILNDFEISTLSLLNMDVFETFNWDENTDVPLFRLNDDSFVWAFESKLAGYNYFNQNNAFSRVFCYNADRNGGFSLRDENLNTFPVLSLLSGYAASAGSLSDPTSYGFLNPIPFFQTILSGGTIGEAYYRSLPFVNWSVSLFGDPTVKVRFPNGPSLETSQKTDVYYLTKISQEIANSIAYNNNRTYQAFDITDIIVKKNDLKLTFVLNDALSLVSKLQIIKNDDYNKILQSLFTEYPDVNNLLIENKNKIPRDVDVLNSPIVLNSNKYLRGNWHIDTEIENVLGGYNKYHYVLQCSFNSNFSNLFFVADSSTSTDNWFYEESDDNFIIFPSSGVESRFSGKRVRYFDSQNFSIPYGTIYYARIKIKDIPSLEWKNYVKICT